MSKGTERTASFKLAKAAATAGITSYASLTFGTSFFMHRTETHGALKLHPAIRHLARFVVWAGGSMKPREWVGVHLAHHANEDKTGDPHSPKQNGRFGTLKVLFGNVAMYRQKAKEVQATKAYPEHLEPDWLDRKVYDKGIPGQIALYGLMARINGPVYGAVALGMHDVFMLAGGGVVNGWLHRGQQNGISALMNEPIPDEGGSYARNAGPLLTILTAGEGKHFNHHVDQSKWQFTEHLLEDPAAIIAAGLMKVGLAQPGRKPVA